MIDWARYDASEIWALELIIVDGVPIWENLSCNTPEELAEQHPDVNCERLYWGVFGHCIEGGIESLCDCPSFEFAQEFADFADSKLTLTPIERV